MTFDERLEEAAKKHFGPAYLRTAPLVLRDMKWAAHWGAQAQREMYEEKVKGLILSVEAICGEHLRACEDLKKWREAGG